MSPGINEILHVPLDGLAGFWKDLTLNVGMTMSLMPEDYVLIPMHTMGLKPRTLDLEVGQMPEGVHLASVVQRRYEEFQAAIDDLRAGVEYCGNAALVLAEAYEGGDYENANGLNAGEVAFAFGDQGARPPSGFRDEYETYSEVRSDYNTVVETEHIGGGGVRTVTTVTDAEGNIVSESVETTFPTTYVPGINNWTKTTETVYDADGNPTTVTTEVKTHSDGTVEVTTTRPGEDGEPVSNTQTVQPDERPAAGGSSDPEPAGPVDTMLEELGVEVDPRHRQDPDEPYYEQYVRRNEYGQLVDERGHPIY